MNHHMLRRVGVALVAMLATVGIATPGHAASSGLTGTVTDALTGAPVPADVVIEMPDGSHWAQTNGASDGTFAFADAAPGQYIVEVQANGYVTQWAYGHADQSQADLITVPGSIQIALMPIQYGSISGRVTTDTGKPDANIGVELDRGGNQAGWATTDKHGAYHFDNVQTGSYTLAFHYPSGYTVWYDNATDQYSATPVTVSANSTVTVNATQPPFGTMSLMAKDAVTGQPLANACFYYQGGPYNFSTACSDSTGKAKVTGIPVGTYTVGVGAPSNDYLNGEIPSVVVTENHTTTKTVRLQKAAKVHLTFVDAATNAPVSGACIGMVDANSHTWAYPSSCASADTYDLTGLGPSSFRLFIAPSDGVHGAQWVGANGGTGDPDAAVTYTVTYGQEIDATVRLDGAGSIVGTVTDAATGQPVQQVCPSATAPSSTYYPAFNAMCTWTDGTYTLANLGPYAWKVVYPEYSGAHAWVWSGGAANRATATPVQVVAGGTVTANAALPASGKISGVLTVPAGGSVRAANIWVVDVATGDYAGVSPYINSDGSFTISGLNSQTVQLYYTYGGSGTAYKYPGTITTTVGNTVSGITITVPSS